MRALFQVSDKTYETLTTLHEGRDIHMRYTS